MFGLTKKVILAWIAIQALAAPAMDGTVEHFAHPSIQVFHCNKKNETMMVSPHVDWNVDKKMKPLVVPSSTSTVMDVILSMTAASKDIYKTLSPMLFSYKALAFMVPVTFAMMVAAILASVLHFIATLTVLTCKIFQHALKTNVRVDKHVNIFDIDLSDIDYDYEVTNVMAAFDPTSMDLLHSVNHGIQLDALMAIDAAFIGPAFVEMRQPSVDFDEDELSVASSIHAVDIMEDDVLFPLATFYVDHHDAYDNDDSSIGFGDGAIYDEIFSQAVAMVPTVVLDSIFHLLDDDEEPGPIKMFREPQTDFDEEDLHDEQDDFDSQMEDLLFSFSKLSFKDSPVKTVSDSDMDELAEAFAKL